MKRTLLRTLLIALTMLSPLVSRSQEKKPLPAATLLARAEKQAHAQHKRLMVIFHASWCGWCHRLDAALDQADFHNAMDSSYIIVHLDVAEQGDKKLLLENPGAAQELDTLGGAKSGLPYYAFLDEKGSKLADSNVMPDHQNIGYPGAPGEIEAFGKLLKQTASHMTDAQRDQIADYLKQNAPAQ